MAPRSVASAKSTNAGTASSMQVLDDRSKRIAEALGAIQLPDSIEDCTKQQLQDLRAGYENIATIAEPTARKPRNYHRKQHFKELKTQKDGLTHDEMTSEIRDCVAALNDEYKKLHKDILGGAEIRRQGRLWDERLKISRRDVTPSSDEDDDDTVVSSKKSVDAHSHIATPKTVRQRPSYTVEQDRDFMYDVYKMYRRSGGKVSNNAEIFENIIDVALAKLEETQEEVPRGQGHSVSLNHDQPLSRN